MLVIVGLGNVGSAYDNTYHNAGFMVLDELAKEYGFSFSKTKHNSMYADMKISGKKVVFLKPKTYMNNSGIAVQSVLKKLKLSSQQLLVIYDDIDIPLGAIRFKENGGTGTHNGMKSIAQYLGTTNFPRIRVGIGGGEYHDIADYVLSKVRKEHQQKLEKGVDEAVEVVESFITNGGSF